VSRIQLRKMMKENRLDAQRMNELIQCWCDLVDGMRESPTHTRAIEMLHLTRIVQDVHQHIDSQLEQFFQDDSLGSKGFAQLFDIYSVLYQQFLQGEHHIQTKSGLGFGSRS
jgi:hypothetical protein